MDENLWELYAKNKDRLIKEKLIIKYAPLVKLVVKRLSIQTVEYEDMISYGIFGLIDAIDKFDPSKGVKFETYASLRVKGAILDSLRKMDWLPRSIRQKKRRLDSVRAKLENELGRPPDERDVALEMGVPLKEARVMINDASALSLISLDEYIEKNAELPYADSQGADSPEESLNRNEVKKILAQAIEKLTDREREVITLHYFEEFTIKEISVALGISESRASQLRSSAISRMQNALERHKALLLEQ
ncbi:MAG: FliA/WhiG family RNA polymerase sigma factor [Clostridiales bacterium]|jgi:RNA polymerase sigma factor for flagellar operon FliA|nr:FliA/WhiG family RNA polymerase sigma factor [Clostridiales bacterium]